jgi:hypothetical protein
VSVSVPGPISQYIHNSAGLQGSASLGAYANATQGPLSIVRMLIPQHLSFTRVDTPLNFTLGSSASANTVAMAVSSVGVLYSRSGSTLNPIIGQSANTTYTYNSNNTGNFGGSRLVSFGLATSLTAGEYYFGVQILTANSSVGTATLSGGWTIQPIYIASYSASAVWNDIGAATASSINGMSPLQGRASSLSATSQTIQQSQITQTGLTGNYANIVVGFNNG